MDIWLAPAFYITNNTAIAIKPLDDVTLVYTSIQLLIMFIPLCPPQHWVLSSVLNAFKFRSENNIIA